MKEMEEKKGKKGNTGTTRRSTEERMAENNLISTISTVETQRKAETQRNRETERESRLRTRLSLACLLLSFFAGFLR